MLDPAELLPADDNGDIEALPTDDEHADDEDDSGIKKKPVAKKAPKHAPKKSYVNKRAPMTAQIVNRMGLKPKSLAELQEDKDLKRMGGDQMDFIELFSPPRLAPIFKQHGKTKTMSIDVMSGWDLSKPCIRSFVLGQVDKRCPKGMMLSPPCTSFSCLQTLNLGKMDEQLWQAKCAEGRMLLHFSLKIAEKQHAAGRMFVLEHPQRATSWQDKEMKKMMSKPGVMMATFDQCRFNLRSKVHHDLHKKSTCLMTNSAAVHEAFDQMRCTGDHTHVEITGAEGGQSRSSWASLYPEEMCEALVTAMIRDMGV